ncbi:hypothetical protein E3N88_17658 [Mikania micrantha]|uniref:Reverse transcriptase Ty1/copia-type domain-containing protein n=1 Tax=Mikania micrantha TaxID=192012 RepID=A0A5N6NSG5_9ASTR|nr:hypothetical protein E3N88_17658 [Mikania micrantha]
MKVNGVKHLIIINNNMLSSPVCGGTVAGRVFLSIYLVHCKQSDYSDYHSRYRAPGTFRPTGKSIQPAGSGCDIHFAHPSTSTLAGYSDELHVLQPDRPIIIYNNRSALFLTQNPIPHKRAKHIEFDYHYIRELVTLVKLVTKFIPTKLQVAGIFTRSLPRPQFDFFVNKFVLVHHRFACRGDILGFKKRALGAIKRKAHLGARPCALCNTRRELYKKRGLCAIFVEALLREEDENGGLLRDCEGNEKETAALELGLTLPYVYLLFITN